MKESNESKFYVENELVGINSEDSGGGINFNKTKSRDIESKLIYLLGLVVLCSFISLWTFPVASFFIKKQHVESEITVKAHEHLSSFASSTGTTALGGLVALLASKRRESS